ncbi:MAG TPA: class I SAM-dependent methyltransferase [Patescibacteria group bacterium]|nr:class I SAM-dependent methyltransferase [Patescibacteria group bacterium]
MIQTKQEPSTAVYYDRHIYPKLKLTLGLGLNDTPSTVIEWMSCLGIVQTDNPLKILEIGCGAGRNLKALQTSFPKSQIFGFDGSPTALTMARRGLPKVKLSNGDIYGIWPFQTHFDLIFDITAGIPESLSQVELHKYVLNLYKSIKPGGYAIIEAISPNDSSSRRFGQGKIVHWVSGKDKKTERLMSLKEACNLYEKFGFKVIASRNENFLAEAFGDKVQREFIQLILQKTDLKIL